MNYKNLMTPLAALSLLGLAACATTATTSSNSQVAACSKAKSAENDASCTDGSDLGPPVVDISKPAPAPGVATPPVSK